VKGDMWVGTRYYGVYHYDPLRPDDSQAGRGSDGSPATGERWTRYNVGDGLADNTARSILQAHDGSVWVATPRGISRFDGRTWTTRALPLDLIGTRFPSLAQEKDGAIWISQLSDAWPLYGHAMPGRTAPVGMSHRVWTTRYEPDAALPETRITLFGDKVSQPGNTTLEWEGRDRWRSTPSEEIQFSHRLDDQDWGPFTHRTAVVLKSLPSGNHTFHVKARDRDFNEDATPASVTFTVVPPVWQEPWFLGLMVVLLGAIGLQTGRVVRRDRRLQESNTALSTGHKELYALNRQLQVDRAVERVRAEVTGMRNAEDLQDIVQEMLKELSTAGVAFDLCVINIIEEDAGIRRQYSATKDAWLGQVETPLSEVSPELLSIYKGGEPVVRQVDDILAKQDVELRERTGVVAEALRPTAVMDAPFAYGTLSLNTTKPEGFADDDVVLVKEFARVIALGYARYLDFQTLEGQTQQLAKDAALQRVRAEVASMGKSDDIGRVIGIVLREIRELGVDVFNAVMMVPDEQAELIREYLAGLSLDADYWSRLPAPSEKPEFPATVASIVEGIDLYRGDRSFIKDGDWVLDDWRAQEPAMRRYPETRDLQQSQAGIREQFGIHSPLEWLPRSSMSAPFSHGMLHFNSHQPGGLGEDDLEIARDFAHMVSLGYARYLDFQRLEEQNRAMSEANKELFELNQALQRERAVERIREQVQTMEAASDFEKVLSLLAADLKSAGLAFETCGIEVLDQPVDNPSMSYIEEHGYRYTAYTINPEGAVTDRSYQLAAPFPDVVEAAVQRFIEGKPWQGTSEGTAIVEVPAAAYGRLRLTASERQEFTDEEVETLRDFATAVALGYARFLDLKAVEEARQREMEELEAELQVAHDMQMGLLPERAPDVPGIDLSGICVPANHVGGDYYQFVYLDEERTQLAIVMADVSGHEMQAATVAMRFNELIWYETQNRTGGVEILKGLDAALKGRIPETMFVTCGIGVLDQAKRSLAFASAGNPEVYLYNRGRDEVTPLGISGCPLGLPLDLGDQVPFNSTEVALSSGDLLVFASDGVEEAQNAAEEFYEAERLAKLIGELGGKQASADDVRDAIVEDVKAFLGGVPQSDDITVVVLRTT
jgi:serine phosphatase RsbU (regulator of sigma subunit)